MVHKVVIAEDNLSGHRYNYVRTLTEGAVRRGWEVVVLTTPQEHAARFEELQALSVEIRLAAHHSPACLAETAERCSAHLVVVPDGDRLALRLAFTRWTGPATLRVLVMRANAQPRKLRVQTLVAQRLRQGLFWVAERQRDVQLRYLTSALRTDLPLPWVQDPIQFEPTPVPSEALPDGVSWVGILGAIDERKNVPEVYAAVREARDERCGLLLAGRLSSDVRAMVDQLPPDIPVYVIDRHLSNGELDAFVAAVSVVVVAHSNESPSGIMGKAVAAGTRILAAGAKTLREDCSLIGPGAVWVPLSAEDLAAGLKIALEQPRPQPRPVGSEAFIERLLSAE